MFCLIGSCCCKSMPGSQFCRDHTPKCQICGVPIIRDNVQDVCLECEPQLEGDPKKIIKGFLGRLTDQERKRVNHLVTEAYRWIAWGEPRKGLIILFQAQTAVDWMKHVASQSKPRPAKKEEFAGSIAAKKATQEVVARILAK